MNHHDQPPESPPPRPPIIHHTTTAQILKQSTSVFFSHFLTFVFLSSLLLTFRSNVHSTSHYLSTFIDRDSSLKSLLSRLDFSTTQIHQQPNHLCHRRRAFLHLSRVGTLDDDFFSGDSDLDRSLFRPSKKPLLNATFLILSNLDPNSGFSNPLPISGRGEIPSLFRRE
ncbi:hypothetical protein Adt_10721 [Abeliophyllum distichum]|uniref:Uncharacterized protein n=1 Tax=Abeliophyllum distichum TaxID=126358 RepID=A0ABD1UL83_9LAMI